MLINKMTWIDSEVRMRESQTNKHKNLWKQSNFKYTHNLTRNRLFAPKKSFIHRYISETHVCLSLLRNLICFVCYIMVMWEHSGFCAKLWHTITSFYGAWRVGRSKIYDSFFQGHSTLILLFFYLSTRSFIKSLYICLVKSRCSRANV